MMPAVQQQVCVESDNVLIEDETWLEDINDGVVKTINMAIKSKLRNVEICTDSAAVYGWVKSVLSDVKRSKIRIE